LTGAGTRRYTNLDGDGDGDGGTERQTGIDEPASTNRFG